MIWTLALALANMVITWWTVTGVILDVSRLTGWRPQFVRRIWAELRPFYLVAVAVHIGHDIATGHIFGWAAFFDACMVLNWFTFRNVDDDDRWKRRKDKVTGKVKALASGRLTVVPAGAS